MNASPALPALPEDPALAAVAWSLEQHGFAGEVWDVGWRLVYLSAEYRKLASIAGGTDDAAGLGSHFVSSQLIEARGRWPTGPTFASLCASLREWGGYMASTTPGGRDGLLAIADPRLHDVLADVTPQPPPAAWGTRVDIRFGDQTLGNDVLIVAVHDSGGRPAGFVAIVKPAVRAAVLGMLALGDAQLFEQMSGVLEPARRPAAILFADLENSTSLARRLSTPAYFALIRRLTRRSDRSVVDAGGIVGKHVGDGVTAFFLAGYAGSESAAARACVESMRAIREAARVAAVRTGLESADVTIRFGLHWGATLYVGRLMTSGRAEITALGDEVNEAARIEACASGGLALASKALIERLGAVDALAVGIDPATVSYTPLATVAGATARARRDAPALAVSEL